MSPGWNWHLLLLNLFCLKIPKGSREASARRLGTGEAQLSKTGSSLRSSGGLSYSLLKDV